MSMHKLSTIIVRNTDSLLMSSFIGLATVGLYSNYRLVINALNNLMGKFAVAFSGSIGNFAVMEIRTGCIKSIRKWILCSLSCPLT